MKRIVILSIAMLMPYASGLDLVKTVDDIQKQLRAGADNIDKATKPAGILSTIPQQITGMYDQIISKKGDIEAAIKQNSDGRANVKKIKATIDANKKITPALKKNLLDALTNLDSALNKLTGILGEFKNDIVATEQEKAGTISKINGLLKEAQDKAQKPADSNLIKNMQGIANDLEKVKKTLGGAVKFGRDVTTFGEQEGKKIESGAQKANQDFNKAGDAFKKGDVGKGLEESGKAIADFFGSL